MFLDPVEGGEEGNDDDVRQFPEPGEDHGAEVSSDCLNELGVLDVCDEMGGELQEAMERGGESGPDAFEEVLQSFDKPVEVGEFDHGRHCGDGWLRREVCVCVCGEG